VAVYRESFGGDSYDDESSQVDQYYGPVTRSDPWDDAEWAEVWAYAVEEHNQRPAAQWNHTEHKWVCTCKSYLKKGICFHIYRFRPETVVRVNEEYL
jgi:hypothetical protein